MVDHHSGNVRHLGRQRAERMEPRNHFYGRHDEPRRNLSYYAKSIGIGGIAMAGVIGIIRSWGIIKSAVGLAAKEMGGKGNVEKNIVRTQRDLSMKIIAIGSILTLILIVLFFYFDIMQGNIVHTLVAIALVAGISFLFTTVAANAIAIVAPIRYRE